MILLLSHVMATCFMAGVIWIIQVVHYPLFSKVGALSYEAYQRAHMKRISWIVIPVMLFELVSGVLLVTTGSFDGVRLGLNTLVQQLLVYNLMGIGLIWASTMFIQVPLHVALSKKFEESNYQKLVRLNWVRTIIWSLRLVLVFYLELSVLSPFMS